MSKLVLTFLALAFVAPSTAQAAPTPAQLCESAIELASAKYAQCRLTAESKYSKTGDAGTRTAALSKCSQRLSDAFSKASIRYGVSCTATEPSSAFDEYLKQCSDDATAAAAGAALPDYVGDLASCSADLSTCASGLSTCTTNLATSTAELAVCEDDLATCEATPVAQPLKTGAVVSYGPGDDAALQTGVDRAYVDNGDGTITDTRTGLMWEKKSDDGTIHDKDNVYSWGEYDPPYSMNGTMVTEFLAALNSGSGFAGHTDWRLPNRLELENLLNFRNTAPAISPAFDSNCGANSTGNLGCSVTTCSCTPQSYHWSSSTYYVNPWNAWMVTFDVGYVTPNAKSYSLSVRAVRGGA